MDEAITTRIVGFVDRLSETRRKVMQVVLQDLQDRMETPGPVVAVLQASITANLGLSVRTDSASEPRESFARCTARPRRSAPWSWKTCFARSMPRMSISMMNLQTSG